METIAIALIKNLKILLFICLLLYGLSTRGQEVEMNDTVIYTPTVLSFAWTNDFLYGTDYYYSNGIEFSIDAEFMKGSPINILLLPELSNSQVWYGLQLNHDFYTPVNIYSREIQYGDRPYAGVLLLSNTKYAVHTGKNLRLTSGISIGVMGPLAGGEQLQNGIHWVLWTSNPAEGWDNQIANEFCLSYSASIDKGLVDLNHFLFEVGLKARAGIPITDLTPQARIQFGKFDDPYLNRGLRKNGWQLFLTASARSRFILYNGTIQGGLLNGSSPYTAEIESYVFEYDVGINFIYKQFKLNFSHHWVTPEFINGLYHRRASLGLQFGF